MAHQTPLTHSENNTAAKRCYLDASASFDKRRTSLGTSHFYVIKCINSSKNKSCNNSGNCTVVSYYFFQYVSRAGLFGTIIQLYLPMNALLVKLVELLPCKHFYPLIQEFFFFPYTK